MRKSILLGLLALFLLVQVVKASDIISCTVDPQEVKLSDQITVTIKLNNTKNETVNDTVKINFPTNYLSCAEDCSKIITISPYSSGSASFTLKPLTSTAEKQDITVTSPASYNCPAILKITSTVTDTQPPKVGSVTPTSVPPGQSTTFTATATDDVGVTACIFTYGDKNYTASVSNNVASYTATLSEGTYSAYFECRDAAGNTGKGAAATITATKQQLSVSVTLPKKTYYPAESFEPKVTVTDPSGKIIVDATVNGVLTYGTKSTSISFFYSTLCDCYKAWYWFSEGTLPSDYSLTVTATQSSYQSGTASATFSLIKPTLQMSMSTDKTEYNPGDSIKITVDVKDSLGNSISNAYLKGEIRDAATGSLIQLIYPWWKEGGYYYDYYVGSESVGKSYTIYINVSWKEQVASVTKTVSITKRGLNADIVLEKNVLMPGDTLQGKIKVFDKVGTIITDAWVNIEIRDANDKPYRWLSAKYIDGFYEIEKWKVEDWVSIGKYTLNVNIGKNEESITLTKTIEITKAKLNVDVLLDQTSYAPGDRIYIKILITYPNGSIVPNAYIGGEIFPLTQEVITETTRITGQAALISAGAVTATIGEPTYVCRVYISPEGPLYYKGEYIQRYYIDDVYIPSTNCPSGKYVLRLRISAPGYLDTEYTKEFDVTLHKLLMETGFKVGSQMNAVEMSIYAEAKDEQGNVVPYIKIQGYLHPLEETVQGCIKRVYLGYDEFTKRYTTKVWLDKKECPAGKYLLEITASQASYEAAVVTQGVEIKYSETFEYSVVVPSAIGVPICREVSCGPDCIAKVCETPIPTQECHEEVTDKECVRECSNKATAIEEATSKGTAAEFDVKNCINVCTKKVACKGSNVAPTENQEMLNKLEDIHAEIKATREQVNVVVKMIRSIIDFFNSIVRAFGGGRVTPVNVTENATGT